MAARAVGLPKTVVAVVLGVESGGRSRAVSRAGAMGCMQLMPGTWAEMRARLVLGSDPFDVHDNMLAGTAYLRHLRDRYGWPGALAAYNAGPARYELYRSAGIRMPRETQAYLARLGAFGSDMAGVDAFPTDAEKHVEWTQAPLFVVNADVVSASPTTPIKRNEGAVEPHAFGGDDVAPTAPGMFVGSRMEAAGAPFSGIFVGTPL